MIVLTIPKDKRREYQARLDEAVKNDTGDGSLVCGVIGQISREVGIQAIAEVCGLERTSFYRTFNGKTDARISNVLRVVRALGCKITLR